MKNIVYLSTSITLMKEEDLLNILKVSRKNNAEHNVSGILLYSEGTFLQVLEGEADEVDNTYQKLAADKRHKNLIILIDEQIDERNFADWSMGFATVNEEKAAELIGYLRSGVKVNAKDGNSPAATTLKTFVDSNNIKITY